MARYSLAMCAAAVIIYENREGERGVVIGGDWCLSTGHLSDLGEAYGLYQSINSISIDERMRPLRKNQAVRDSIANSKDGKEMFHISGYLNYPGISNAWGRVFELDERWRDLPIDLTTDASEEGAKEGARDLSPREQKLVECVRFLAEEQERKRRQG